MINLALSIVAFLIILVVSVYVVVTIINFICDMINLISNYFKSYSSEAIAKTIKEYRQSLGYDKEQNQ